MATKDNETTAMKPYITPHIYSALVAVALELSKVGIAKDRQNTVQNFRFRGIDEVMNTVGPILAKHDVVLLSNYDDYPETERVTGKGTTLITSKLRGVYTFVSAKDGSTATVTTFGVAMDSGDKGTNKAMSAALKYALLQTFLIPTEGDVDADASTPDESAPKPPDGLEEWYRDDIKAAVPEGFDALASAWRTSPKPFRDFILAHRRADWEAAKAQATGKAKS